MNPHTHSILSHGYVVLNELYREWPGNPDWVKSVKAIGKELDYMSSMIDAMDLPDYREIEFPFEKSPSWEDVT